MFIAEADSLGRTALRTTIGDAVSARAISIAVAAAMVGGLFAGCATAPSMNEADTQNCKTRVAQVISDRDALLATARAEIAAGKIAAAKQEAELQELRKAVSGLRRDNAAAHHAVTTLQQTVDTAQAEVERTRKEQVEAEHRKQERDFSDLRATMQMLAERLDQLSEQVHTVAAAPAVLPEEPLPPKPAVEKRHIPKGRSTSAVLPIAAVEQSRNQLGQEKGRLR